MQNGLIKKSDAQRHVELEEILKAGDRAAAFRWLREEFLIVAENIADEGLPDMIVRHHNTTTPAQDVKYLEEIADFIRRMAQQLSEAHYPGNQVPQIPFPFVQN